MGLPGKMASTGPQAGISSNRKLCAKQVLDSHASDLAGAGEGWEGSDHDTAAPVIKAGPSNGELRVTQSALHLKSCSMPDESSVMISMAALKPT